MVTKTKKKTTKTVVVETPTKTYPHVTVGSHLTVTEYEDGRTTLEWDDDALLRDVQDAIKAHETTEFVGRMALGKK